MGAGLQNVFPSYPSVFGEYSYCKSPWEAGSFIRDYIGRFLRNVLICLRLFLSACEFALFGCLTGACFPVSSAASCSLRDAFISESGYIWSESKANKDLPAQTLCELTPVSTLVFTYCTELVPGFE